MKNTLNTIDQKFQELLALDKKNFTFNRKHFFLSILDRWYDSVSSEQKLDMMHYFTTVEKCLNHSRDKSYSIAAELIEYLDNYELDLPEVPYDGMMTSYYPMLAFFDYAKGNYDVAKNNLSKSFKHIKKVYDSGEPNALLDLIEQQLNMLRLAFDAGNDSDSLNKANKFLLYVFLGDLSEGYYGNVNEVYNKGGEDKIALFKYYFDSVFKKLNQEFDLTDSANFKKLKIIFSGFEKVGKHAPITEHKEYRAAFSAAIAYINGEHQEFLVQFEDCIEAYQNLPEYLQIILLEWYSEIRANDDAFVKKNQYFRNYLNKYPEYKKQVENKKYKATNNPLYFVKEQR